MSTECGENQESETRVRRIRPSRARGLRATTGCLTCRKRRIKCDENKPECNNCDRAERNCTYGRSKSLRKQPPQPATSPPQVQIIDGASVSEVDQELNSNPYHTSDDIKFDTAIRGSIESPVNSNPGEGSSLVSDRDFDLQATHESLVDLVLPTTELDLPISQEPGESLSAPDVSNHVYKTVSDWYDLVAQAAITDFEKSINPTALPWRQSGGLDVQLASVQWVDDTSASYDLLDAYKSPHYDTEVFEPLPLKLWNTENRIVLTSKEVVYFQYYVEVIGPILDLMDLSRQFSNSVPHLATHNFGLSRAIIAVAAQHASLHEKSPLNLVADSAYPSRSLPESLHSDMKHMAAQCYYETLQYLSYHITQPSYCQSPELSATAVLISMYEMFNPSDVTDTSNWERHLRGGFWIQRTQNNNAEMENNIGRATWCSWVRQDIWFAFRENRRTLTLFRPHKPLESLNEEELITRILPMAARCVDFVAEVNESCELNVRCCIERGELLLTELNHWYSLLPDSFHPISTIDIASPNPPLTATSSYQASSTMEMPVGYLDPTTVFTPLWVHPPAYAAAIQMYHFAMIMVLLNQPLTGGRSPYLKRQKLLNKSVDVICGLAASKQGEELPNAWVNSQALFAAGLCVQSQQKKDALLVLLHKSQNIFKVPQKSLAEDLQKIWKYDN